MRHDNRLDEQAILKSADSERPSAGGGLMLEAVWKLPFCMFLWVQCKTSERLQLIKNKTTDTLYMWKKANHCVKTISNALTCIMLFFISMIY